MARAPVDAAGPGVLRCACPTRPLLVRYDPRTITGAVERIAITDARLAPVWGDAIYRVILIVQAPRAEDAWVLETAAG